MLAALARYTVRVIPAARAETARWRSRAEAIPDPAARRLALATLDEEAFNAEAAAVYSLLAPRAARPAVVRLLVPWQLMYDYLDTLTEQPSADPLEHSRRLHRALALSIEPHRGPLLAPEAGDGGYLDALVAACRQRFRALAAAAAVAPSAAAEARRCGEAQSQTHAAMLTGDLGPLRRWAAADRAEHGLRWWETAAAGISSLAVHALLASAADPATTAADAARIADRCTAVCALSTMLDSLVDVTADERSGNVSYVAQYPGATAAGALAELAAASARAAAELPHAATRRTIVSGLAAFYLTDPNARATPQTAAASDAVIAALQPSVAPALRLLRLRRRLGAVRGGR
jgi:tetraprenyl-beta-curcumene synthase